MNPVLDILNFMVPSGEFMKSFHLATSEPPAPGETNQILTWHRRETSRTGWIYYVETNSGYPWDIYYYDSNQVYWVITPDAASLTDPSAYQMFTSSSWPQGRGGIAWNPRFLDEPPALGYLTTGDTRYQRFQGGQLISSGDLGAPGVALMQGPYALSVGRLGQQAVVVQTFQWGGYMEVNWYAQGLGRVRHRLYQLQNGVYQLQQDETFDLRLPGGSVVPVFRGQLPGPVPPPPPPSQVTVTIQPGSVSLAPSGTQQFTATVANTTNQTVTWQASGGAITPAGLFTAPQVSTAILLTVTATSVQDPTRSTTVNVSVQPTTHPIVVTVTPQAVSLTAGQTQQFSATLTNTVNMAVTWTATQGTIDAAGLFSAPNVTSSTQVTITATSVADPTRSGQATVTVDPVAVITVSISPLTVSLTSGQTQQFTATVGGTTNQSVTWHASTGTITTGGLYTAPTVSADTTVTVTATSAADNTKSAQATFTVHPAGTISVTISPSSATVISAHTQQFTATVTNATPATVTWTASGGTITSAGLFTAPTVTSSTTVTVTATSVADTSKKAQVTVTVTPAIAVTVTPTSATLTSAHTQQFAASVTGTTNVNVTWSASTGTISASGLYTAPTVTSQTSATITATSVADTSKHATATVTVNPAVSGQIDLVQWWQLSSKATQHLVGDPSAPYHVDWVDSDPGYPSNFPRNTIWAVKNKLGHPWDVLKYDNNLISHWMTENGDSVDQAACQAANGTSCWLYNKAYKRDLTPIPLMPRFFTPGTSIVTDTPASATTINATTDCEATVRVVHLGPVHCITSGYHKISWGGSIDKGAGTLANGPNFDPTNGVNTIRSQYYFTQDSSQPSGYASLEETYYVLGYGRVAWYYYVRGVFQQKTVNTTLASGGHPVLSFPCGPGKPWFV